MRKSYYAIIGCLILAAISLPLYASGDIATVNGKSLPLDEFSRRIKVTKANTPAMQAKVLDAMIMAEIIKQLADQQGVTPTSAQMSAKMAELGKLGNVNQMLKATGMTMSDFKGTVFTHEAALNIIEKNVSLTDAEVRIEYEKNKKTMFTRPEYAEIAGIMCTSQEKAKQAYAQVKKGKNFFAISTAMSDYEWVRKKNGHLGTVAAGQPGVPPEIAKKALSLKDNAVSEPFNVKMGGKTSAWVILKVLHHFPKTTLNFDSVKVRFKEQLMARKGDPILQSMIDSKRKGAKIVIVADKYKNLEKLLHK